jgi:endonuclease/exonuclease/phosphatase family metal-dependent hydrolase
VLVRSWNVYHGRTYPPGRRAYLRPAIELVTRDEPEVVCLQELPEWSLPRLEGWSKMAAFGVRTRRGLGRVSRRLTDLNHAFLRSSISGQANAILVDRRWDAVDCGMVLLTSQRIVEPRICHAVRVRGEAHVLLVVNVHLSHHGGGEPAAAELDRALEFAEGLSRPGEPVVIAGDFNLTAESEAMQELVAAGYSPPGRGIDHILVRGMPSTRPSVWPAERRTVDGRVLSDHPPVELTVG